MSLEREVSTGYFQTLKAKLLRGRFFTEADDATKPKEVMINKTLAEQYFPGEDPVGNGCGDLDLTPKSMKR